MPPKYTSADFRTGSHCKHRGKLDVPKEWFISYPGASRDGDPLLLIDWAGWDHREQAQALATLIVAREQEDGWAARPRLLRLVAGLREILPWVRQWHVEYDPNWGASPADTYDGFLDETAFCLSVPIQVGQRGQAERHRSAEDGCEHLDQSPRAVWSTTAKAPAVEAVCRQAKVAMADRCHLGSSETSGPCSREGPFWERVRSGRGRQRVSGAPETSGVRRSDHRSAKFPPLRIDEEGTA